jgi:hypothetical protein
MWPLWFKLLEQRERDRGFALTFPFLVGAIRSVTGSPRNEATFTELLALLASMRDETPESDYVRISECDRLHRPVANKMTSYFTPGVGFTAVPSPLHGRSSLFVQTKYLPDAARGIESIAATLWDLCGPAISDSRFSFKNGDYVAFSQEDQDFVLRATLMSDDDET